MNDNDNESKDGDIVREEFIELRNFLPQTNTGNPILAGIVLVDNIRTLKVYQTPAWKVETTLQKINKDKRRRTTKQNKQQRQQNITQKKKKEIQADRQN